MTIGTTRRNDGTGNDSTATYPYGFKIFAATQLEVKVKKASDGTITTLSYPTQYSVTNVGNKNGGNVVLSNVGGAWQNTDGTLKTGYTISTRRVVTVSQTTDIRNQGGFFPDVHEDKFDFLTMIDQQQQDEIDRSIKLNSAYNPTDFDLSLPAPVAGAAIGWDAQGDGLANLVSLGGVSVTAFTQTLLDDASADAFLDTIEAALLAETSPATADRMLLDDVSAGTWDYITLGNLMKILGGMTLETAPAVGDMVGIYDLSATDSRSMTLANLMKIIGSLTAEASPAVDDLLALYDTSGTSADSIRLDDLFKVINGLTADGTPDIAADYVVTYDASAGAAKKALLKDLKKFKVGNFTRAKNGADATTGYTGIGFKPKAIVFITARTDAWTDQWSVGFADGTSQGCISQTAAGSQNLNQQDKCIASWDDAVPNSGLSGFLASFDTDGFSITWDTFGATGGTLGVTYIAFG